MKKNGSATFEGYEGMGNILFINALKEKEIQCFNNQRLKAFRIRIFPFT